MPVLSGTTYRHLFWRRLPAVLVIASSICSWFCENVKKIPHCYIYALDAFLNVKMDQNSFFGRSFVPDMAGELTTLPRPPRRLRRGVPLPFPYRSTPLASRSRSLDSRRLRRFDWQYHHFFFYNLSTGSLMISQRCICFQPEVLLYSNVCVVIFIRQNWPQGCCFFVKVLMT